MTKQFFKDLPDTSTPLNSARINGLLDGDEPMGQIVVDSIRTKNMFNKDDIPIYINNNAVFLSTDNGVTVTNSTEYSAFVIYKFLDVTNYVGKQFTLKANITTGTIKLGLCDASGGNRTSIGETSTSGAKVTITIPTISGTAKYLAVWLYGKTNGTSTYTNIQLESGSIDTTYMPFQNLDTKGETYSTSEQKIGTWIDGKPLYRIVVPATVNSNSEGIVSLTAKGVSNPDTIIINVGKSVSHYNTSVVGGAYNNPNYYSSTTDFGNLYVDNNKALHIKNTSSTNRAYYICIEYTKTTD